MLQEPCSARALTGVGQMQVIHLNPCIISPARVFLYLKEILYFYYRPFEKNRIEKENVINNIFLCSILGTERSLEKNFNNVSNDPWGDFWRNYLYCAGTVAELCVHLSERANKQNIRRRKPMGKISYSMFCIWILQLKPLGMV